MEYTIISVRENGAANDRKDRFPAAGRPPEEWMNGGFIMSILPAVFGENMMDVFNDFDRDFFRGFARPEHMLYGKNAQRMMKTDVKETYKVRGRTWKRNL